MSINLGVCYCGSAVKQKDGKLIGRIKKDAALCLGCKKELVNAYNKYAVSNQTKFKNFVEDMAKKTGFTIAQLCSIVSTCS